MIEILSKFSGIFKSGLPLLLLTALSTSNQINTEKTSKQMEDNAPGDNFPYAVMSSKF